MENSKIQWCDHTFNPWIGCQHVSPGCDNCYAETMMDHRYGKVQWGPHGQRKRTSDDNWRKPRRWAKKAGESGARPRAFCASLADVFDNKAPDGARDDLFRLIRATPELDWLLLTKRPQNIAKMLPADWGDAYPNVWLGITAEDEERYRMRWPILSRIPAVVRFVSYEPAIALLGSIDISTADCLPDWIICGGESGGEARVMDPAWARDVRDQCRTLGIAFFLKQWGTYWSNPLVQERGLSPAKAKRRDPKTNGKGGALLDGRLHRDFPCKRLSLVSSRGRIALPRKRLRA